jgi:hypothetical protein
MLHLQQIQDYSSYLEFLKQVLYKNCSAFVPLIYWQKLPFKSLSPSPQHGVKESH